jgi:glucose/arabinose dehydrogenase
MKKLSLCSFLCLLTVAAGAIWADVLPEKYRIEPVIRNVTNPQAMALAPDGRIFYLERTTGDVHIIKDGKYLSNAFVNVSVSTTGEEGLLGIALHPDFASNGYVYLYYTQLSPHTNRIVRYTGNGDTGTNETVILDSIGNAPGGTNNGGGLVFGNDGKLYATVGDLEDPGNAQNGSSLKGKVLQIDVETAGFPYNIYAQGFRNAADISVNTGVGTMYATDNYDSDDTCDETNVITGTDYGWNSESCTGSTYQPPLHAIDPQCGASGLAPYTQSAFPGFTNDLFIAGDMNGEIMRDVLSGANYDTFSSTSSFYDPPSGDATCPTHMKDVVEGADGWLYAVSADPDAGEAGLFRILHDDYGNTNAAPREVSASNYVQMTVEKDGSGLRLNWEDLKKDAWGCTTGHCPSGSKSTKYTVWSGDLSSLPTYNHTVLTETNGTDVNDLLLSYDIVSMPPDDTYYLVSARGANLEGTTGYDSTSVNERPGHTTTDLCNAIGWGQGVDQCTNDWPNALPDQNNTLWSIHDWRGLAIKMSFVAFT